MAWQEFVKERAKAHGLTVTSGFRTKEHNAEIGGAPGSWHTHGTVEHPGAMDVAGDAHELALMFLELFREYSRRINELYLNVDDWIAIRDRSILLVNPERARPHHLHIALRD